MWHVYILLCTDNTLYTGATNNLQKRFQDHVSRKGGAYTRSHPPQKILYTEAFPTKSDALKREHAIKQLTRKQKITSLHLSW